MLGYAGETYACNELRTTGTGIINLCADRNYAINDGLIISKGSGKVNFKGKVRVFSSNIDTEELEDKDGNSYLFKSTSSYFIDESKKIVENTSTGEPLPEQGSYGFIMKNANDSEVSNRGYFLTKNGTNQIVTNFSIITDSNNPLNFVDMDELDMGVLLTGRTVTTYQLQGLVFGGTAPYTFEVTDAPVGLGVVVKEGCYLDPDVDGFRCELDFSPTVEMDPGEITVRLQMGKGILTPSK